MDWLPELLIGLCAGLVLRLWVLNIACIRGSSMLPTLHNGDRALVWRLGYRFRAPRRQEVVICHYPGRHIRQCRWIPQVFVKRVVGLPGDVIEFIGGVVFINGQALDEPYLDPARCRFPQTRSPRVLGADEYFVLGDHRDRSSDSRMVGPIRRRDIRGRVICILTPLRRIQKLR